MGKDNSEYIPFLSIRSVSTEGKANCSIGWKTEREHHFLSNLEYAAFYYFDWSDEVSNRYKSKIVPVSRAISKIVLCT